jgi:Big-like domain-containing protein/invasin-like protein
MDTIRGTLIGRAMLLRVRSVALGLRPLITLTGLFTISCTHPPVVEPPPPPTQLGFTVPPSITVAGAMITPAVQVAAQDASGHTANAFTGPVTVALGVNPAGGALSGGTTVAAVAGVATFTNLSIDKAGAGYTLTAAASRLTGATSPTFAITVGSASRLVFVAQPTATAAGALITPAVQVTAQDAAGNTATGFTGPVTVAILNAAVGDTLFGTTSVTAVKGIATFTDLLINKPGTYALMAAANGLTGATSTQFTIMLGPVSATRSFVQAYPFLILTGSGNSIITVAARDAGGNPLSGASVVLGATGTGNTLTQPVGSTDASGIATGTLSSSIAETKTVSATINGTAIRQTASIAVDAVSATQSTVSATPASIAAVCGRSIITVTARDAAGTPLGGAPVTLTATGTGNTVTEPVGPTNASGVATATLGSTVAETKIVSVTLNGTLIAQAATVTVSPGPPTQLCFTVQPSNTLAGRVITPAVQVTATDASGQIATGFTGPVTVAIGSNSTTTLLGTTSVAPVNGVATFANLSIKSVGTGYTLTAAASGFSGATSVPFNVVFYCGRACF